MSGFEVIARLLITMGILILVLGLVFLVISKLGGSGFRMPGDIFIQKGNFSFFFPITTCIIISIVLSIIFYLFRR